MKLTRRSFIASVASAGLLSVMPSPVRAWADDLYLPSGIALFGFDNQLLAVSRVDIWRREVASSKEFHWPAGKEPKPLTRISYEFYWAITCERQKLSMKLTMDDFRYINIAATSCGKYPPCVNGFRHK